MKDNTLSKILLLLIHLCFIAFPSAAEKITIDTKPLAPEEAFVMDHIIVGPSEAVVRWQILKFYYLYKEKFIFSSKEFFIDNIRFPVPEIMEDPFFGSSEVYHDLVEVTLSLKPKTKKIITGILNVTYQGCWEGGICYPPSKNSIKVSLL